jgi:hypothetical protein
MGRGFEKVVIASDAANYCGLPRWRNFDYGR